MSHPASLCPSSPHLCLPTPGIRTVRRCLLAPFSQQAGSRACVSISRVLSHTGSTGTISTVCVVSYHGNHWTRAHVGDQSTKEWSVLQVDVVLLKEVLRGLQHRESGHISSYSFLISLIYTSDASACEQHLNPTDLTAIVYSSLNRLTIRYCGLW